MNVFEKIKAQQGKERSAVWMVGEQLSDIIRHEPELSDIVDKDLDVEEMSLSCCEKKIKDFADGHKTGNFACVTPIEAERIIREFYGLPAREDGDGISLPTGGLGVNLSDFFG